MRSSRVKAFIKGWASVLDLSGWFSVSIPDYRNGPQRDREAIAGDWETVGQDLRQSMDHLSSSTTTHR